MYSWIVIILPLCDVVADTNVKDYVLQTAWISVSVCLAEVSFLLLLLPSLILHMDTEYPFIFLRHYTVH